jgi:hypothetical protein
MSRIASTAQNIFIYMRTPEKCILLPDHRLLAVTFYSLIYTRSNQNKNEYRLMREGGRNSAAFSRQGSC